MLEHLEDGHDVERRVRERQGRYVGSPSLHARDPAGANRFDVRDAMLEAIDGGDFEILEARDQWPEKGASSRTDVEQRSRSEPLEHAQDVRDPRRPRFALELVPAKPSSA